MHTLERVVSSTSSYYARARNRAMPSRAWLGLACAVLSVGALSIRARAQMPAHTPGSEIPVRNAQELIAALRNSNPDYQKAAKAAIERASPSLVEQLVRLPGSQSRREAAGRLIERMGRKAVPTLLTLLDDEATAARAGGPLSRIPTPQDADLIPDFLACAQSKPLASVYCATAVVRASGPAAAAHVAALSDCVKSASSEIRPYCVAALGKVGAKAAPAVPVLIKALSDALPVIRAQAAASLGEIGPAAKAAAAALRAAAKDASPEVRKAAAAALRRVGA